MKSSLRERRRTDAPRTKLKLSELLEAGQLKATDLARAVDGMHYTQIYPLLKPGANPKLSTMESLVDGLSVLLGRPVTLSELLGLGDGQSDR